MRNLKKFLALVLAMMMAFSLMLTVNAASFNDAADINTDYTMAADILDILGVIKGNGSNYYPKAYITRAEFAAILYRVATGDAEEKNAAQYKSDATAFPDVDSSQWYAGQVGYAARNGLLKGASDGNYWPNGKVTSTEVVIGLLRALGYDANGELVGTQAGVNALIYGGRANILGGVGPYNINDSYATREMVAQLAFDTLNARLVVWREGDGTYVNDGTNATTLGAARFGLKQLYYGTGTAAEQKIYNDAVAPDEFGRPGAARVYTAKNNTIVIPVAAEPVKTFDAQMAPGAAAKELKAAGVKITDWATTGATVYQNGDDRIEYNATAKTVEEVLDYYTSVNNNVVEVYVDDDNNEINRVVVCNIFSAKLGTADVVAAKGTKDAYIKLAYPTDSDAWSDLEYETTDFAKDDVVYWTRGMDNNTPVAVDVVKADSFTGTISRVTTVGTTVTYTIGGKAYVESSAPVGGAALGLAAGDKGTFWTDGKGLIIHFEAEEEEQTVAKYYIIEDVAWNDGVTGVNGSAGYVEARLVDMTGATSTVKLSKVNGVAVTATSKDTNDAASIKSANAGKFFFTMKATATGAELTKVPNNDADKHPANAGGTEGGTAPTIAGSDKIEKGKVTMTLQGSSVPVNNDTVFVVANKYNSGGSAGNHKYDQYIGRNKVPTITFAGSEQVLYLLDEDGIATYVFVGGYANGGLKTGDTKNDIFILDLKKSEDVYDADEDETVTYNTYYAIVDGVIEEVILQDTTAPGAGLYTPTYEDGYVTKVEATSGSYGSYGYTFSNGTLTLAVGSDVFSYEKDVPVFFYGLDVTSVEDIVETTAGETKSDAYNRIIVVADNNMVAQYIVIIEKGEEPQVLGDPDKGMLENQGFDDTIAGDTVGNDSRLVIEYRRAVAVTKLTIKLTGTKTYQTIASAPYSAAGGPTGSFSTGTKMYILDVNAFGETTTQADTTVDGSQSGSANTDGVYTVEVEAGTYTLTITGDDADNTVFVNCTIEVTGDTGEATVAFLNWN